MVLKLSREEGESRSPLKVLVENMGIGKVFLNRIQNVKAVKSCFI